MLFSLAHAEKKKGRGKKKKKKLPEGRDTVKTPSMCYQGRCSPATMAVLAYLGLTAGPKLLRDRRSSTRVLPPESMSWFMLMLLRYCKDSVPLQTTVYLPVLNFSGGYGHSVHTNEDGFVCRGVFLFFFPLILADKVSHSWMSKLSLLCSPKTHAGLGGLIINRGWGIKTVTYGSVCLFLGLSAAIAAPGLFVNTYLQEFYVCVSATKHCRLKPSICNLVN